MLSAERKQLAVGSWQWAVGSGQLAVGSGQWARKIRVEGSLFYLVYAEC